MDTGGEWLGLEVVEVDGQKGALTIVVRLGLAHDILEIQDLLASDWWTDIINSRSQFTYTIHREPPVVHIKSLHC